MIKEPNNKVRDYTLILPHGKENALSVEELAFKFGYDNVRSVRHDVARSRLDGQVILSTLSGGYFLPSNQREVEEFLDMLTTKIIGITEVMQSAKHWLNEEKNKEQLSINDIEGDI